MNIERAESIKSLFFNKNTAADIFNITPGSAGVICSRYVKKGIFIRLKRDLYMLKTRFINSSENEKYQVANILQVPSYISFTTALAFYGATTQMQRSFIESAAVHRTKEVSIGENIFKFVKLQKKYYSDFIRRDGAFIASAEKALMDAVYMASFGKYYLDSSALDISKIDIIKFNKLLKKYPFRTKKYWENLYDRIEHA